MVRGVLIAAVTALALTGVAAGGPIAAKQRVAIDGKFRTDSETGTFKIIPLTAGALKADSGKFTATGNFGSPFIRNGRQVQVLTGTDTYSSAKGTLTVGQRLEVLEAGRDYQINTGNWTVVSGTGVYEGYKGGGSFAGVVLPNGVSVFFREEGYLTKS